MSLLKKVKEQFTAVSNGNSRNGSNKFKLENFSYIVLDAMPSLVAYIGKDYRYNYVNKAYANWYGVTPDILTGKMLNNFLDQNLYRVLKPYLERAMSGEVVKFENEISLPHGKKFMEAIYTPDIDDAGCVNGIVALITDITARKNIGNQLVRKQSELEEYVQNALIGIHWVDANGIILWANKAELDLLGYSENEYVGHHISEFHHDAKAIEDIMHRLSKYEPVLQHEAELKRKDGSLRTVMINSNVLVEDGKFIHTRCFTTDIHDLKLAEKVMQESELGYQALIENLPSAIYTCDKEGRIRMYNKAAVSLWGREPEIGKDLWCGSWKIYEPDGVTPLAFDTCPMAITLKEGRAVEGEEIVIERPDGEKRNVRPYPVPLFDLKGKLTGAVNMLVDITETKIAELKLSNLAAIVRSSDDAIISKSLEGVVTSWNDAAERIFGYSAEEMIGQPITKLIPDELKNEEPMILERLKNDERVDHFETKRIRKDKKILDISLTISPLKNNRGIITGASKIARDITYQKLSERAIRDSEERFRMAVESTRLGTWEYYPLSNELTWSAECRKIFDVPDEVEINFDFFSRHIHPEDAEFANREIEKAMNPDSSGHYDIQYRILRYSDKKPRWIRAQGKVYFNEKKLPERFIGTVLDISEDKFKEQELQDSVDLFTTMADNVPVMIWMSGTDKFSDFFNKTWLEFTGRAIEQESNEGWLENVHPDDAPLCVNRYKESFKMQKDFYTEYRLKRHDGEYRWIADNSVARFDPDGSFAGFISACTDIDNQKRFREKIQESELLLKTISNAAPVGLWMTDTNAQNTFVNDTWIRWTSQPLAAQLGVGWLSSVIEEDRAEAQARFMDSLNKREKYTGEFRIMRKDGEMKWCLTEGSPYYDINGDFAGYSGSVTDITDMKKLEERKDDFIKMASHELKTPITSIKGYVQLLLNIYEEVNEEKFRSARLTVKSSLHTISKQVSKLTRLVSELLDLSRIESGKLELHKTEFDLGNLVEETAQDVRHTTTRHAIIIHNDFEGNIYADKDRVGQVLLNLLTNAIKYSPDSDNIEVSVSKEKGIAVIKVRDFGIGIEEKDQLKIFERFYRVEGKSEQTYPGFGIGLFIASEIINRHDGIISVQSKKGTGSVFIIKLPVDGKSL